MEETLWNSSTSQQPIKKINYFTDTYQQCCVTVTIAVPVSVPTLEKFPFRFRIQIRNRIQTIFSTFISKKSCLFNDRSSIVSQKVVILLFLPLYFILSWNRNRIRNWNWNRNVLRFRFRSSNKMRFPAVLVHCITDRSSVSKLHFLASFTHCYTEDLSFYTHHSSSARSPYGLSGRDSNRAGISLAGGRRTNTLATPSYAPPCTITNFILHFMRWQIWNMQ